MLNFILYDLQDRKVIPQSILSYELSRDIDAPCDGLRLSFINPECLDEIYKVEAFDDGEKVFNGFVDVQREQLDENGYMTFLYARSSACILVDNEAEPRSYQMPSLLTLYELNAKDFGFDCALPNINCSADYLVGKGVSCYEAINNLAKGITGRSIIIDVDNRLIVPENCEDAVVNAESVMSERRIINRGKALSRIDYKISNSFEYNYHIKSRYLEQCKINRTRKMNICTLPLWQQEIMLKNMMSRACTEYYSVELLLSGSHMLPLYAGIDYKGKYIGSTDDYSISSCRIICDSKGERTKIIMNKEIDPEEITYVAE